MSNQLGNHKNVLGISSQSWAIILVPVLPGLPIHLFLAETMCLPISLPYKKNPCSGQMLCTGLFSLPLFSSEWNPVGKACGGVCVYVCEGVCVCVCVDTFSFPTFNLPASCLLLFLPWLFLPPFEGLSQASCKCSPKLRNWKGRRGVWIEKRMKGRTFHLFYPLPQLWVILLSDSDSCSYTWVLPIQ